MNRVFTILILAIVSCSVLMAHSGRTDSSGGHHDRINGGYHYHNSGSLGSYSPYYPSYNNPDAPIRKVPTLSKEEREIKKLKEIIKKQKAIIEHQRKIMAKLRSQNKSTETKNSKTSSPKESPLTYKNYSTYKSAPTKIATSSNKSILSKKVTSNFKPVSVTENHWQVALNNKEFKGRMEVTVSTGRVDILTDKYAIEVDKVSKYQEGIEQSLKYAKATGKKPLLALYIDGHKDGYNLLLRATELCKEKDIKLILINSYVSVKDLNDLIYNSNAPSSETGTEFNYWLNTGGNTRHNSSCRYFKNTSKGRSCSKSEGKACGICGG